MMGVYTKYVDHVDNVATPGIFYEEVGETAIPSCGEFLLVEEYACV